MSRLIILAIAMTLYGCVSSSMRETLPPEEKSANYTINHGLTKRQAYDTIEVEIAKIFVSARAVTDVKQPDNGRLVLKAISSPKILAQGLVGETIAESRINYSVDIQTDDKMVTVEFAITGHIDTPNAPYYSGYPSDMAWVRQEFDSTVESLRKSIKGVISVKPGPLAPPKMTPSKDTSGNN